MKLLNGSELAAFIKERQAKQVRALRQAYGIFPRLAIVTNVDNEVINVYMRLKEKYGEDILVDVEIHRVAPEDILKTIEELNNREDIQGIIVQLPVADMSEADNILAKVNPDKDVDGLGRDSKFEAATPMAVSWLLVGYGIDLANKKIAIVGKGRLVGSPLTKMWQSSGFNVESYEKGDSLDSLQDKDIIVTATGVPGLIKSELVGQSGVVVDAGTAVEDGVVCGDVAADVRERDDLTITPEKGGVGPLTVAALFDNVITACLRRVNS